MRLFQRKREDGAMLIAQERRRQIDVERWTPEHDEVAPFGALVDAAICYLKDWRAESPPALWPWKSERGWKPSDDYVDNLVKAGALIAAEIDRVHREREQQWFRDRVHG